MLCPVLWASPGGFLLVMRAAVPLAEMMSPEEYQEVSRSGTTCRVKMVARRCTIWPWGFRGVLVRGWFWRDRGRGWLWFDPLVLLFWLAAVLIGSWFEATARPWQVSPAPLAPVFPRP
jgi:hypothetical protein